MPGEIQGVRPARETLTSLCSRKLQTIDDVMVVMRGMDALLEPTDGLKWFNLLYLTVSEAVQQEVHTSSWSDLAWLQRLDMVFADLYFPLGEATPI